MGRKLSCCMSVVLFLSLTQLSADSSADSVIQMLNQTVTWYHLVAGERDLVSTPADAAFVNDNARAGDQIVRLAFEFARSEAKHPQKSVSPTTNTDEEPPETPSRYDALREMARTLDARTQQSQQEIESLRKQLDTATGSKRRDIQSAISETQSELQLFEARRDVVHTMVDFVGSTMEGLGPTGLAGKIEALSHSVPASLTAPSPPPIARREALPPLLSRPAASLNRLASGD